MTKAYERFIRSWENRLCNRATNRVVRQFEWGLDWTRNWSISQRFPKNGEAPEDYILKLNKIALLDSDEFFAYKRPEDFRLEDGMLRFSSPVDSPYPENNVVHARWFPAASSKKAVVLLPHWNCPAEAHYALCRGLQRFGISTLRISMPYHDYRMPAELERADYAMSANVCRTIDAARQAVIDVRCCFDWLESQGYQRLGIVGTSLGSSYACLASAHDPRIAVNVFNHCSTYVADVVWSGLSTQHVRKSLEEHLDLDRLREAWRTISPISYLEKFASRKHKSLFIYASYDTTFPPQLSRDIVGRIRDLGVDHKVVVLPCGHYTLGETPFKFIDGYHICRFMTQHL